MARKEGKVGNENMKKSTRLLAIVRLLNERPHTTRELASLLNVSERTIQQDLQDLRDDPLYLQLKQEVRYQWRLLGENTD